MVAGDSFQFGFSSKLGYAEQLSLTARLSVTNATVEFMSEGLDTTVEPIYLETLRDTVRARHRRVQGNKSVAGTIEYPVNPIDGYKFFKYAFGGVSSTVIGVTNAYNHTFYPTDTLPASTDTALTICVKKGLQFFDYVGCKVNGLSLRGEMGQPLMASVDIVGLDSTQGASTTLTNSYSDLNPFMMVGSFTAKSGDSLSNLTTTTITRFELSVNNNIITGNEARALGSRLYKLLQPGVREVELTVEQRFDTIAAWSDFVAGTRRAFQFTIDSGNTAGTGGTTCAMIIGLPHVYYDNAPINVSGEGPIMVTYAMKALYDSTTAYDVRIQLTNTQTSI